MRGAARRRARRCVMSAPRRSSVVAIGPRHGVRLDDGALLEGDAVVVTASHETPSFPWPVDERAVAHPGLVRDPWLQLHRPRRRGDARRQHDRRGRHRPDDVRCRRDPRQARLPRPRAGDLATCAVAAHPRALRPPVRPAGGTAGADDGARAAASRARRRCAAPPTGARRSMRSASCFRSSGRRCLPPSAGAPFAGCGRSGTFTAIAWRRRSMRCCATGCSARRCASRRSHRRHRQRHRRLVCRAVAVA